MRAADGASPAGLAPHERVHALLDRGAPWEACDAFRESVATHSDDAALLYCGALAHARTGAGSEALPLLERAERAVPPGDDTLRVEILALRGRLWKDALRHVTPGPEADALAARARDEYLAAYAIAHDPFPGINAATLALLAGERDVARALAGDIEAALARRGPLAGWDLLTAAEAALLRGDLALARQRFAAAWSEAGRDAGRIASVRRQLKLLARALPEALELLPVLRAPDVVAFTGHMVDAHDRAEPRFPAALEPAVAAELRARVAAWHAPILFASAACGADLLMLEAALDAGAEVNVVLPFARDAFVRTSVAPGGARWVRRFDDALARASRVLLATDEGYLGDDELFDYAACLVEGLAVLRASQVETAAQLVALLEPGSAARTGGTRAAVDRWRRHGGNADIVDLSALRVSGPARAPGGRRSASLGARPAPPSGQRTVKAMLFADVAGYSRLKDAQVPRFQRLFWDASASVLAASAPPALLANTWGDALFAVFDGVADAAALALALRDRMRGIAWEAEGLPATTSIRIALHAAPVYRAFDPVLGRDNFFGSGVTRAARIEPVTPPGLVYVSEAFAAALAATGQAWALEYVGTLHLAKQYGESRLYRLEAH